jgi:hypothetical protein
MNPLSKFKIIVKRSYDTTDILLSYTTKLKTRDFLNIQELTDFFSFRKTDNIVVELTQNKKEEWGLYRGKVLDEFTTNYRPITKDLAPEPKIKFSTEYGAYSVCFDTGKFWLSFFNKEGWNFVEKVNSLHAFFLNKNAACLSKGIHNYPKLIYFPVRKKGEPGITHPYVIHSIRTNMFFCNNIFIRRDVPTPYYNLPLLSVEHPCIIGVSSILVYLDNLNKFVPQKIALAFMKEEVILVPTIIELVTIAKTTKQDDFSISYESKFTSKLNSKNVLTIDPIITKIPPKKKSITLLSSSPLSFHFLVTIEKEKT